MALEGIPTHLQSSYGMLKCAYPKGVGRDDYLAVLFILHNEFSQRNLAELMTHCFQVDYSSALNDVYFVGSHEYQIEKDALEGIRSRLEACGFADWLKE
jgi:hypothetical protein